MNMPALLQPRAALIIPSHNRADLIGATLDSALAQTHPFDEIIVVDDGSTDHTAKILATYKGRVRHHRTDNQGVQAARNTGVALTNAELLVFLDSDDLLTPDFLATVLPWLQQNPDIGVLYCNFTTFTEHKEDADKLSRCPFNFLEGAHREGVFARDIPDLYVRDLDYQPFFTCGMTVRRSFIEQHGGYLTSLRGVGAEDWEFTLRAICQTNVALCIAPLAKVRKHGGNDSASNLHMRMGEVSILRWSLQRHENAQIHQVKVEASIQKRLWQAFDTAFDQQRFDVVRQLRRELSGSATMRQSLKYLIASLPPALARLCWRAVQ